MGEQMAPYSKTPKVQVDGMGMYAAIRIPSPATGEQDPAYTKEELLSLLQQAGVSYGILQDEVAALSENPVFDRDVIIARGEEAKQGENGHYEYHFSQEFSNKPTIRPDGSADFLTIKVIEVVHEGDLIASYHPAIPGEPGTTVKNTQISPAQVRDMPPLGGRGFHRGEDNCSYYADMDGKIVLQGNRILISPVYEIERDADMAVGNIDFKGDVVIHGGVKHGIQIHATGSITVDGLVEHCEMKAGKDIFLLSGVKGGERTQIQAGGAITAEFIEYAMVICKGELRADVLFNCLVNCESRIIATSGKRSAIIGGQVTAVEGIIALMVGNKFGTVTNLTVGMDVDRIREMTERKDKIAVLENNINKIKKGIEAFDALEQKNGKSYKDDPRRMQLLRVKIRDEAALAQEQIRMEELQEMYVRGKRATIKVYKTVNAGVTVRMMGQKVRLSDYQEKVEFVKTETGIRMEVLDEPIPD